MAEVYHNNIIDIDLESGTLFRSFLNHTIGSGDNNANWYGVRVFRKGQPIALSGCSVQGLFMPASGSAILISDGTHTWVSGNEASVLLPQACYNVKGQFTLTIKIIGTNSYSITDTVRIIDGVVADTYSANPVAPTAAVPTYQEILAVYEQMVAAKEGSVRFDIDQTLTAAQMTQARGNIEAASAAEVSDLKSALPNLVEYEVEHTISGGSSNVVEDIQFNFIKGGHYKVAVLLTNPLANVRLQLRDRINDPLVNDTIYNNAYVGEITFQAEHSGKYLRYISFSNATITITAVTISYNYEKEEADIADINSHILFDVSVPLIDNKIIPNNTSVIDPTLVSNANAKCCIVACNLGDIYVITGTGMSNNSKLYAFTDAQYKLITNSNTTASNLQIQAPSNGYLICNFYKGATYSLIKKKSKYIDVKFGELETKLNQIETDITPPLSGIDMFGKIACLGDSFTVGGVRNSTDTGWLSARNSYPAVLHNRHTIPVTNFGASGSTTKTYYANNIQTVLNAEAHDVYFLCWGLNDAWGSMTIGSASDIHEDYTTNPDTYFGNYGKIIATLRNAFPMARFVLITPWRNVSPFNAYQEPSIEIAETMGIPYIDTRTDPFFQSALWENTLVSSHPTQVTYTGMAYAVERLMEKCIADNELYFRYAGLENEVPIDYD